MNEETVYVRTPSLYGNKLSYGHITPDKIYKADHCVKGLYHIIDDTRVIRGILLENCAWLAWNNWEITTEEEYNKQENIMNSKKLTRAECLREHARVIEMCEGTDVNEQSCIRLDGVVANMYYLGFNNPNITYTFAIRIHEGKPVFEGDTLYYVGYGYERDKEAKIYLASRNWNASDWEIVSWTKPEINKTCNLNGTDLPLADGNFLDYGLNIEVYYRNKEDRDKVREVITKLLHREDL